MQTIFNCCHGTFQTNRDHWLCSTQGPQGGGLVDEEIIGDESPAYKTHLQPGEDASQQKASPGAAGLGKNANQQRHVPPPPPIGHGYEEEKESAKVRLQRLIRDFAHDAVGQGLEVEAQSSALDGLVWSDHGILQAVLRMDRRLSRLELWPPSTSDGIVQGASATFAVPLQQVASIAKGIATNGNEIVEPTRDSATLTVAQRNGPDLGLLFDNTSTRDRAYTCLRIFQMSVDQSLESHSREQTGREESEIAELDTYN